MGGDLYMLSQQIAIQSHGELVATLRKVRDQLVLSKAYYDSPDWLPLIGEIDRVLNNASIR